MSRLPRLALTIGLVTSALVVSAVLYVRSRTADFGKHARAVEAIGTVRHLDRLLAEQILAARAGLLNQYDPITSSELGLTDAAGDVRDRVRAVLHTEGALDEALDRLDDSIAHQLLAAERFKSENAVLKNSIYYLPTAARALADSEVRGDASPDRATSLSLTHLVQAALVYDLVGDQSARAAHLDAMAGLSSRKAAAPSASRAGIESLLAHANVIAERQPAVDRWLTEIVDSDVAKRVDAVENIYHMRFGGALATSNRYRKILYGWSMLLLVSAGTFGWQLRRVYADLEKRVAERTTELRRAVDALWGEMKLARKIQEALVPATPVLANCEVAASMRATDEVGGDYYDVIRTDECEWILIGDVSGHGVPAGLVMMMCHTAVRTVLRAEPKVTPERLLTMVNAVLTSNIQQLGEDKYMTLSALRRDPDGTVLFAGAHQDIHIYRAATDDTETLETSGLWLGIKDDIASTLTTGRFRLGASDLLLLHTDGITEATRDGALFDTKGLLSVLGQARGKSADEVLRELFAKLEDFAIDDDATLLVIRQLGA